MSSYQTVQVVAYSATPLATDFIALAPGYTVSLGSIAVGGGVGASSGTSFTPASALSITVTAGNAVLDLSTTGVAAGSYVTVAVDVRGRVTAGSTSMSTAFVTGTWTSGVSASDVQGLGSTWTVSRLSSALSILGNDIWASTISAATYNRLSSITFWEAMSFVALGF